MSRATAAPPKLAATILLLRDDPFEVLMIRRRAGESFGSALVFPGGVVDAEDHQEHWLDRIATGHDLPPIQRALRIAGLREVYEEVGLIAAGDGGQAGRPAAADFGEALGGVRLDLEALAPFGHWITPEGAPRRFDTYFFLCLSPPGPEACCDGSEAIALEWAAPADLLARADAGERALLFPTRMNLARLAESRSVAEALAAARARPIVTVLPQIERRPDGIVGRVPGDAGYPLTEIFMPY
ncbi:NUDIX hydrolase [Sphingomonas bacterium]|uniref:NUDIX hydrolase n=1 Tax=Sphingomonas bacterium TaxID=1895847 RepID=UPI001575484D|nr:NUDIX hydrolase [Sphingomonas bacterium]